jgi:hypothetical protein
MFRTLALLATVSALGTAPARGQSITPTLLLGFRHEPGVESKMLIGGLGDWQAHPRISVNAGAALSLIQHAGLSRLGFGIDAWPLDFAGIAARVQHEQWNDWQAGENRLLVALTGRPVAPLRLAVGLAYRAPVFDTVRYGSPFYWRSEVPERNLLYRVELELLHTGQWQTSAWLANFDRFTVHNPQQFPFGLDAAGRLSPCLSVSARAGTAINGLSGLLLSLSELNLEVGVSRAFY